MISWTQFHFIDPWWFLALIPLLYIVWCLAHRQACASTWENVCDQHLLKHLVTQGDKGKIFWPFWILTLVWLGIVFALAGPTWSRLPQPVYKTKQAKVIILDLSPSMLANDVKPSRLQRAKFKILDILDEHGTGQIGMVVFADEPYTVSPLTEDANTIAALVPQLTPNIMPVTGHNIGAALKLGAKLIQQAGDSKGQLIVITDSKPTEASKKIAKQLQSQGITTSVLGIGTTTGAPVPVSSGYLQDQDGKTFLAKLNNRALYQLAQAGNGRYADFTLNDNDIKYLLQNQNLASLQAAKKTKEKTTVWRNEGHYLLWFLLPFVLLAFRRGWLEEILT